jgi:uncharacterized MAPEG superfamily protein
MTTPLWCLLIVALLPYVLSTLSGVFRQRQFGAIDNKYPRRQQAQLEGIGARAMGAQANAWEALPFFTTGVLAQHLAGAEPERAALLSVGFVATRVLHAIFYLANLDVLRSITFLVGMACVVGLFVIAA